MVTLQEFIAEGRGNQKTGKFLQAFEEHVHALETESDDGLRRSLANVFQSPPLEVIEKILGHSDTIGTEDWTVCNCPSKTIGADNFRTREPRIG